MSVGSAKEENFVFFSVDFFPFFGRKGQAYLKTLDVGLLAEFFNVGCGSLWRLLYLDLDRDDRQREVRIYEPGDRKGSPYRNRDNTGKNHKAVKIKSELVVIALNLRD